MSYAACPICETAISETDVLRTGGQWFHRSCYDDALRLAVERARAERVENLGADDPQPDSEATRKPDSPWEVWTVKVRRKLIAAGERDAKRKKWSAEALERMAERNPDLHYEDGTLWMSVEVPPEQAAALVRPKPEQPEAEAEAESA